MAKQLRGGIVRTRWQPILMLALILLVFAASYGASRLLSGSIDQPRIAPEQETSSVGAGAAQVSPPFRVSDFTLTSKTGEPMSLSELRGKPTLLVFGYTNCPDVCPMTLAEFTQVKTLLGDNANDVNFLFVTVDGQRDTPQVMTNYLDGFDESFYGMIGDDETLTRISNEYGLVYADDAVFDDHDHADGVADNHDHAQDEYSVGHSSPSFLIDQNGFLRTVFFFGAKAETMADNVRELLGESA
ncbi:MAG: SCO family protein [Anaerolineae bacterium]|nr:SCO family protein [Anaerolineae bacterium]